MSNILEISYVFLLTFIIYASFGTANIIFGVLNSVSVKKEDFSWKKLFKGIGKSLAVYAAVLITAYACMSLPYLNNETIKIVGEPLFAESVIEGISVIGVLSSISVAIVHRANAAIENIKKYFEKKED